MSCNYWSLPALRPSTHNEWAPVLQQLKPNQDRDSKFQLLSLSAAIIEARSPSAYACNKRSHRNEKTVHHSERVAPALQKKKESSKIHSYISRKVDQDTWPKWLTIKIKIKEGKKMHILVPGGTFFSSHHQHQTDHCSLPFPILILSAKGHQVL